VAMNSNRV